VTISTHHLVGDNIYTGTSPATPTRDLMMSAQPVEMTTRAAIKGTAAKYVKLNVGGALFNTTFGTLTKLDNMLRTMFGGRMQMLTDADGMRKRNIK